MTAENKQEQLEQARAAMLEHLQSLPDTSVEWAVEIDDDAVHIVRDGQRCARVDLFPRWRLA